MLFGTAADRGLLRGGATGGGLRAAVSGRARGHLRAALLGPLHLGRGEHGGFLRVLRAALLILRALGLLGHLLGGPLRLARSRE